MSPEAGSADVLTFVTLRAAKHAKLVEQCRAWKHEVVERSFTVVGCGVPLRP